MFPSLKGSDRLRALNTGQHLTYGGTQPLTMVAARQAQEVTTVTARMTQTVTMVAARQAQAVTMVTVRMDQALTMVTAEQAQAVTIETCTWKPSGCDAGRQTDGH